MQRLRLQQQSGRTFRIERVRLWLGHINRVWEGHRWLLQIEIGNVCVSSHLVRQQIEECARLLLSNSSFGITIQEELGNSAGNRGVFKNASIRGVFCAWNNGAFGDVGRHENGRYSNAKPVEIEGLSCTGVCSRSRVSVWRTGRRYDVVVDS